MALTDHELDEAKERLAALKEARDLGATEIRYRDRTVRYRSLDEIRVLIKELEREISGQPRRRRPRTFGVYTRKGV